MRLTRKGALAVAATVVSLLCITATASAASPFGCRASVARVGLFGQTVLEPLVADNPESPCQTDSRGLGAVSIPSTGNPVVDIGPASAYTSSSSLPGAGALADVQAVTIPTSTGSLVIGGPVYAAASYSCSNGSVVASGTSSLDLLYINGTPVSVTPNQNETLDLGGGSYVSVNEQIQTGNSLTERVLDVHLAGLADVVVGEAQVTENSSNPCAGSGGGGGNGGGGGGGGNGGGGNGGGGNGGGNGGGFSICPNGSTYNPADQYCEIMLPGGGVIIISRPFAGPTGGTVISLSEARQRYHSSCLYGPGPDYAIVGTNGPDHINGTRRPERILGLAGKDVINGGGGNDCIDGGAGNDHITDADGNVRVYGGKGNDNINVRNGNDRVWGNAGKNTISVGRGNDWVWAGPGVDTIYMDNGPKHVWAGGRGGRVYAPGARDAIHCKSRKDNVRVNMYAVHFAVTHGCVAVHRLVPARLR